VIVCPGNSVVPQRKPGEKAISASLTSSNGKVLEAGKAYKVAGWAGVGAPEMGKPVWEVVTEYLADKR
jgi:hypothetical protein